MKYVIALFLSLASAASQAEVWKWDTNIGTLKAFNNSNIVCFKVDGVDKQLCFDKTSDGGSAKLSMLLSAKMAKASVDASYSIPPSGEMAAWYDHTQFYKSLQLYLR